MKLVVGIVTGEGAILVSPEDGVEVPVPVADAS